MTQQTTERKVGDTTRRASNRAAPSNNRSEPFIGAVMDDGTVYAGISPDSGKPMYATPADAPLTFTFNQASDQAATLNFTGYLGHIGWRVPTIAELNVPFNNRAAIGEFNEYWSASPCRDRSMWCQRFSDGALSHASVRPVR